MSILIRARVLHGIVFSIMLTYLPRGVVFQFLPAPIRDNRPRQRVQTTDVRREPDLPLKHPGPAHTRIVLWLTWLRGPGIWGLMGSRVWQGKPLPFRSSAGEQIRKQPADDGRACSNRWSRAAALCGWRVVCWWGGGGRCRVGGSGTGLQPRSLVFYVWRWVQLPLDPERRHL